MSNASLDRLLAVLLTAAAGTGFLTLHSGQPGDAWLFVLHDLVTGALGIAAVVKLRRSLPRAVIGRRWPRLMVAVVLTGTVGGALAGGYLWVAGGGLAWVDLASGRWTVLTLHAWLGLAIAAVAFIHLLPHRWRLLRPGPAALTASGQRLRSRRAFLAGSSLAVASVALVGFVNVVDRLNGGVRRFTGSRWLPLGSRPIPTTFLGEEIPTVDLATWHVRLSGAVTHPLDVGLQALRQLGEADLRATLDCTSGWAVDATWRGIAVATLLDAAGVDERASLVTVSSLTGWSASFSLRDARRCLLARAFVDGPLSIANGGPLRLVAPDHRGLEWVKWVNQIDVR